ncbi:MAG: rubrerythrin-like domain-containing protein [Haloplanus sp.]
MPTTSDPAPCDQDEQLYECLECGKRLCSSNPPTTCPGCGGVLQNLSRPRPE